MHRWTRVKKIERENKQVYCSNQALQKFRYTCKMIAKWRELSHVCTQSTAEHTHSTNMHGIMCVVRVNVTEWELSSELTVMRLHAMHLCHRHSRIAYAICIVIRQLAQMCMIFAVQHLRMGWMASILLREHSQLMLTFCDAGDDECHINRRCWWISDLVKLVLSFSVDIECHCKLTQCVVSL